MIKAQLSIAVHYRTLSTPIMPTPLVLVFGVLKKLQRPGASKKERKYIGIKLTLTG
jgi:hypothetical protein